MDKNYHEEKSSLYDLHKKDISKYYLDDDKFGYETDDDAADDIFYLDSDEENEADHDLYY